MNSYTSKAAKNPHDPVLYSGVKTALGAVITVSKSGDLYSVYGKSGLTREEAHARIKVQAESMQYYKRCLALDKKAGY